MNSRRCWPSPELSCVQRGAPCLKGTKNKLLPATLVAPRVGREAGSLAVQPFCPVPTATEQPPKELLADCVAGNRSGCCRAGQKEALQPCLAQFPQVLWTSDGVSGSLATVSSPVPCVAQAFGAIAAGEPAWDAHLLTATLVKRSVCPPSTCMCIILVFLHSELHKLGLQPPCKLLLGGETHPAATKALLTDTPEPHSLPADDTEVMPEPTKLITQHGPLSTVTGSHFMRPL